jgi:hypothetical protein
VERWWDGQVRSWSPLGDVVDHYDALRGLSLTAAQKADLVEYLKSL